MSTNQTTLPLSSTKRGEAAIWESGGADETESRVTVVANADGSKPTALFMPREGQPNGDHALIVAKQGMVVIRVTQTRDYEITAHEIVAVRNTAQGENEPAYVADLNLVYRYFHADDAVQAEESTELPEHLRLAIDVACGKACQEPCTTACFCEAPSRKK